MTQDSGEAITSFAARLKGQARLCLFKKSVTCKRAGCNEENEVDFTDTIIMGELVRGLADTDIKTIVLGEVEQKTELDELIKLIQAKEYAKSSTASASPSVNALVFTVDDPCPNCAGTHTKAPGWRESCPAKGKKCSDCSQRCCG